jgi:hypothetical protein
MHRRIERRFEPSGKNRRDFLERKRERCPPPETPVFAEADQIERMDVMFARQRLDVVPPPVR